jgi:hypothetical protein
MKATVEIDMPNMCKECNLVVNEGLNIVWCCVTKDDCEEPYKRRNNNCPLIEKT